MTTEPAEIIERLDRLVADTSPGRDETISINDGLDPTVKGTETLFGGSEGGLMNE